MLQHHINHETNIKQNIGFIALIINKSRDKDNRFLF